jgi:hypothetical protein
MRIRPEQVSYANCCRAGLAHGTIEKEISNEPFVKVNKSRQTKEFGRRWARDSADIRKLSCLDFARGKKNPEYQEAD